MPPALAGQDPARPAVRVGSGFAVPWSYINPAGSPAGFYVDVLKEAARREGVAYEAVLLSGGPERSLHGKAVDLWAAAVPTEARRKHLYFTEPWWSQEHYLAVSADGPIHRIADLSGHAVVHGISPPFTADLKKVLPGAALRPMDSIQARFAAVCSGNADAVLFYHERTLYSMAATDIVSTCRERGLRLIPVRQSVMEVAIASLPENRAIADRLRERIQDMQRDGTLARLAEFPLTGNENLLRLLENERIAYRQRTQQNIQFFLLAILVVAGLAIYRLRRANRETREALAVAEKALDVKREFLATISHEIRTPMTAVLGYMDMLMGTPLRHDQRRFAAEVTRATQALLTVMTTMLSYGKPGEIGGAAYTATTLDPAAVLDDCLSTVLLAAEAKGLALTMEVDPAVPRTLCGDPVLLRQAVLNLMSNAVKFTAEGGVRLRARYARGSLTCVVSDSGPGIPEEKLAMIFEPFTQIEPSDRRTLGGVGLGLAIVADICRKLGGDVRVDRAPEGGARFMLQIPYEPAAGSGAWLPQGASGAAVLLARDRPAIATLAGYLRHAGFAVGQFENAAEWQQWTPPAAGRILCIVDGEAFGATLPAWSNARTEAILAGSLHYLRELGDAEKSQFGDILPLPASTHSVTEILSPAAGAAIQREPVQIHRRVLVADDNAVNRRVLSALLEKLGCRVDLAENGREAVEAASRERYTAILMDCQMPVMDGYEATRAIRRDPSHGREVPICGISASLNTETRRRCEESGMNEYMAKPVTIGALQDLLVRMTARQIIAENSVSAG